MTPASIGAPAATPTRAPIGRGARAVLAVVLVASLAACTTATKTTTSNDTRERVTPSDEPDAQKRARSRLELAAAYFERGQSTTALDQIKLSILADPTYGDAWNLRGLIYARLNEPELAEESFRRALLLNPRDGDTMHNYGFWLCQQRRYDESKSQFSKALAEPRYQGLQRTLLAEGVCEARAGRLAEADAMLTRAYELDPSNPYTATNLAEVLYRRAEFERARFYIRRVNSQSAIATAQTLWLAARIEDRLGNRQGADEFGRQIRSRFPDAPEAAAFSRGSFDD